MKIRYGAIVDNIVTNLYAKFNDDQFCCEMKKTLVHSKSVNSPKNFQGTHVKGALRGLCDSTTFT